MTEQDAEAPSSGTGTTGARSDTGDDRIPSKRGGCAGCLWLLGAFVAVFVFVQVYRANAPLLRQYDEPTLGLTIRVPLTWKRHPQEDGSVIYAPKSELSSWDHEINIPYGEIASVTVSHQSRRDESGTLRSLESIYTLYNAHISHTRSVVPARIDGYPAKRQYAANYLERGMSIRKWNAVYTAIQTEDSFIFLGGRHAPFVYDWSRVKLLERIQDSVDITAEPTDE